VSNALRDNPTPGVDAPASPQGTLNDIGSVPTTIGPNLVRSFLMKSPDRSLFTDIVANYTLAGEHCLKLSGDRRCNAFGETTPTNYWMMSLHETDPRVDRCNGHGRVRAHNFHDGDEICLVRELR
jgi:hypothetical protein